MKILGKEFEAVIFDMDGTLIDSTGIWIQIDIDFFAKRGIYEVPADYSEQIVHMGLAKGAAMTIEKYGFTNDTVEGVIKEWRDASIDQYKNKIQLKPYAIELLELLRKNNIKIALATANDKDLYQPCLDRLGVEKYFDFVTDVNQTKQGKSSPEIYDSVCAKLGVAREKTLVLEDTIVGLTTAFDAGYIAIGVDDPATKNCEAKKIEKSFKYIYSFKDLIDIIK